MPDRVKQALWYVTDSNYRAARQRIASLARARRRAARLIWQRTGGKVASGPFAGMSYLPSCGPYWFAQKLLGTYEMELKGIVEEICEKGYRSVIDIGAAEGYYACGLAYRMPAARVWAFEAHILLHQAIRDIATANGLTERVEILGSCDRAGLREALREAGPCLLVCDVEGAEMDLLDPRWVPELSTADMLVEVHDEQRPGASAELDRRFLASHTITHIRPIERVRADVPESVGLDSSLALQAMDECRGDSNGWFWMRRR